MQTVTQHYEKLTGRSFYGLAGYHYSVPEWGFKYHPGGERIERWSVTVPSNSIFALLLLSAVATAVIERRRGKTWILASSVWHLVVAAGFFLVAAWYSINITGVFI